MNQHEWLAEQFEAKRSHLRAVAYRMLGWLSEADDAVQEALHGQPQVVFDFTITGGKIVAIDLVADPERLRQFNLVILED